MPISIPSFSSAEPFFRGLSNGMLFNMARSQEITVLQGRNHFIAAFAQMMEAAIAFDQMDLAFKAYDLTHPIQKLAFSKFGMPLIKFGVPAGLAFLASSEISNIYLRKVVNLAQEHVGSMCLIASIASNVALFAIGQQLMAGTTLLYLGIGFLDRQNLLPERVHQILDKGGHVIGSITGLVFGGTFVRLISIVDIAMTTYKFYLSYMHPNPELIPQMIQEAQPLPVVPLIETPVLVTRDHLNTLNDFTWCEVNQEHLNRNLLPPIREGVTLDRVIELSEAIEWENHRAVIHAKLEDDERWREIYAGTMDEIAYFKQNLQKLVNGIKNREILQGRPQNFQMVEAYLLYLAQELANLDEMTQADYLITLGIEGGEYCGPGAFRVIEELFSNMISHTAGVPFEWRLLACLQQERIAIFQQIYDNFWKSSPIFQLYKTFMNMNDVHNYDTLINLTKAGPRFGIPHQGALNDEAAYVPPSSEIMCKPFNKALEKTFWQGSEMPRMQVEKNPNLNPVESWKVWRWYKVAIDQVWVNGYEQNTILQRLKTTIGTAQLPKAEIYVWWQNWIQRQPVPDAEKALMEEELMMFASINGESLETEQGEIRPKFLIAMLQEMGVLRAN
ncbi:MAG: hypothetical protein H0V82_01370 [Candidatus Protochlamydia sp.]|nr:hypothetical protein [Candidatus Protochlamydia sp.]